jgi:hypothetical protein
VPVCSFDEDAPSKTQQSRTNRRKDCPSVAKASLIWQFSCTG